MFVFAASFAVVTSDSVVIDPGMSRGAVFADQITGAAACGALFLRRRWPVQLAVGLLVAGTFSHYVTGATMVALFTVADRTARRTTAWVAALAFAPVPVFIARWPDPASPETGSAITYFALVAAAIGWGLFVRSRRDLVTSLRERAARAADEARQQARADIAREMHDVLAHRLSLLSLHAGALEFNPGAPAAEVQRAAGVIRQSAHQALQELREIIGVLRAPEDGDRPQPALADLERLVGEARTAGTRVTLRQRVASPVRAPALAGRTAYRVVQEGLTNARKHAVGAEVTVVVSGGPGDGLSVEVRNPAGAGELAIPGGGRGLIGLAERAALAGGRFEHGPDGDDFRLFAWLPWPRDPRTPG